MGEPPLWVQGRLSEAIPGADRLGLSRGAAIATEEQDHGAGLGPATLWGRSSPETWGHAEPAARHPEGRRDQGTGSTKPPGLVLSSEAKDQGSGCKERGWGPLMVHGPTTLPTSLSSEQRDVFCSVSPLPASSTRKHFCPTRGAPTATATRALHPRCPAREAVDTPRGRLAHGTQGFPRLLSSSARSGACWVALSPLPAQEWRQTAGGGEFGCQFLSEDPGPRAPLGHHTTRRGSCFLGGG